MEVYRDVKQHQNILLADETIQWQARPQSIPLLSAEFKLSLLTRWISCALVFAALTILYAVAAARAGAPFYILIIAVLFLALAYACVLPMLDLKRIDKKVLYYVTDKRVLLVVDKTIYALNRSGINIKQTPSDGGTLHIAFGSCANKPVRTSRRYALMPEIDENDPSQNGFVFYAVKDNPDQLKDLFSV